jgi:cation transport ATPase
MSFVETHDVVGMTCDHYARAVRTEVSAIAGVTDVNVDVTTGVVRITAEQIRVRHGAPRGGRRGGYNAPATGLRGPPRRTRPPRHRPRHPRRRTRNGGPA